MCPLGAKLAAFPIEENHKLALVDEAMLHDASRYRTIIRRLIYLTITRPNLSYVVHILSQFMQAPWEEHMEAVR